MVKREDIDSVMEAPQRPRSWSLANATIPLMAAIAWIGQLGFFGFWIGSLATEVHTLTKNADKADAQVYQQKDATRDFALMQAHVDAMARRIDLLEQENAARRR
jgi:hypothetical protein